MKIAPLSLAIFAVLLGCSTERYQDGGFETSDLKARILSPAGKPLLGARVWLVRSRGEADPASTLDSTLTDSVGEAHFRWANSMPREGLGLDARLDSLLGISSSRFAFSDTASVILRSSGQALASPDSSGRTPKLFVPGSHFTSISRTDAPGVQLTLPYGTWTVVAAPPGGTRSTYSVSIDAVPYQIAGSLTTSAPDLSKDSIFLDGQAMAVRTIQSPVSWIKSSGQDATWGFRPEFVSDDTGALAFATSPVSLASLNPDSIPVGFAGEVGSDRMTAIGAVGIHFKFFTDPGQDRGMERWIHLVDSTGAGMRLQLGLPFLGDSSCTALWQASFGGGIEKPSITTLVRPTDSLAPLRNQTWWISWNADSICVRSESGIFRTIRTDGHFGRPVILLGMGDKTNGTSRMQIDKFRFYRP